VLEAGVAAAYGGHGWPSQGVGMARKVPKQHVLGTKRHNTAPVRARNGTERTLYGPETKAVSACPPKPRRRHSGYGASATWRRRGFGAPALLRPETIRIAGLTS